MECKLIRSFICIELGDEAIKEAARVQEILSGEKFTGKMTELENLHLTLKFLGEIDDEKLEKVKDRLKKIEFKEFEGRLLDAGVFSVRGNPKIVWIKLGGKEIFDLQSKIDEALKDLFPKEERFMSHMTIARVRYVKQSKEFIKYVENMGVKEVKWKVNGFYLKKSELKSPGPVYTTLEEYKLAE